MSEILVEGSEYEVYGESVNLSCWLKKHELDTIQSALRLQELIKERIKEYDEKRKETYYPSKKRGMLYKKKTYLQNFIDESQSFQGVGRE